MGRRSGSGRAGVVALVCASIAALALAAPGGTSPAAPPVAAVIVQGAHGTAAAAAAVERAGGTVLERLPIVDGVAASVPAGALARVAAAPGVRAVTPDHSLEVGSTDPGDPADATPVASVHAEAIEADRLWAEGVQGRGVRVALVDTGISPVADLTGRIVPVRDPFRPDGGLVACVDLSGEGTCADTYGHGTFVAGLVAGSGASTRGAFRGVAPAAELVSVKIAGRDGSTDVSKVLAAIQWVVSFAPEHGIRVLNLSLGTDSTASWRHDPLNLAVQRAWRAGIVVVVAAGNRGPGAATISKPADDPFVITVGAVDDRETAPVEDDRLPDFTGRGPTAHGLAKPDVVAPGSRVVSLRAPGSLVDEVGTPVGAGHRRGSGTSMAAAVTSGAVALALEANPRWSPDRVKFALAATARRAASDDPGAVGAGTVSIHRAARTAPDGLANRGITQLSDGSGSLDASRGRLTVDDCRARDGRRASGGCVALTGSETAQHRAWDASRFREAPWTGTSWYTSQWQGTSWYGTSWYGTSWYGTSWYGTSWYGVDEPDAAYGHAVPGSSSYGAWE